MLINNQFSKMLHGLKILSNLYEMSRCVWHLIPNTSISFLTHNYSKKNTTTNFFYIFAPLKNNLF